MLKKYSIFLRRMAAITYDTLLIFAIFIIATALLLFLTKGQTIPPGSIYYQIFLGLLWFSFLLWFWTHGGQTAGMAAWRIRLETTSGNTPDIKTASLRLSLVMLSILCGGLGLWWALWDKDGLTLYDRFSNTRLKLVSS